MSKYTIERVCEANSTYNLLVVLMFSKDIAQYVKKEVCLIYCIQNNDCLIIPSSTTARVRRGTALLEGTLEAS